MMAHVRAYTFIHANPANTFLAFIFTLSFVVCFLSVNSTGFSTESLYPVRVKILTLHFIVGGISFLQKGTLSMHKRWTLTEMKEIVLSFLALLWGVLFLFPGETLASASRIDLMEVYAGDVVWGSLLIGGSLFLLFSSRQRFYRLRRAVHVFFWLFWLAMGSLVLYRSVLNGLAITDILISSPYFAIALVHASFYIRLVYVK